MGVVGSLEKVALSEKEVEGREVDHAPLLPHHHAQVLQGHLEQYNDVKKRWEPLGFFSRRLKSDKQKWSTFKRELYSIHQAMRFFHDDFIGRHLVVWTDHRPVCDSFVNPDLQKNDPVALAQMAEIGQFTHDVRFIEGKSNITADLLSRPWDVPLGEAYIVSDSIEPDHYSSEHISSICTDNVSLETFSADLIQKEQES